MVRLMGDPEGRRPGRADVMQYHHRTDDPSRRVADRRRAAVYRRRRSVARNQGALGGQFGDTAGMQRGFDRIGDPLTRVLVDDLQHLVQRVAGGLCRDPTRHRFRDWIEVRGAARRVGGNDPIAYAGQGDLEQLTLLSQLLGLGGERLARRSQELPLDLLLIRSLGRGRLRLVENGPRVDTHCCKC